jgi:hypothetical protein
LIPWAVWSSFDNVALKATCLRSLVALK